MEIWQPIKGYEGLYEVSSYGNIKSFHKEKDGYILKQAVDKCNHTNYRLVMLVGKNKNRKTFRVHRLVAMTFIDNLDNKPQINHKDNNGENNNVDNLEWCTNSENTIHSVKQGRHIERVRKANKSYSKSTEKKRIEMVGKKYGSWLILRAMPREFTTKRISKMLCECECGTRKEVDMISLRNGRSTQCKKCAGRFSGRKKNANTI